MKVKTALILFVACFIAGNLMFFVVIPRMLWGLDFWAFSTVSGLTYVLLFVGLFGFFGTVVYCIFIARKKTKTETDT